MNKTRLIEPTGSVVSSPSLEVLKELLLKGNRYWEKGSGDIGLEFQSGQTLRSMTLICRERMGTYVEYMAGRDDYDTQLCIGDEQCGQANEVWVGGEKHHLPACAFVSNEIAERAISCFLSTGLPDDTLTWKRRSEIDWPDIEDD